MRVMATHVSLKTRGCSESASEKVPPLSICSPTAEITSFMTELPV